MLLFKLQQLSEESLVEDWRRGAVKGCSIVIALSEALLSHQAVVIMRTHNDLFKSRQEISVQPFEGDGRETFSITTFNILADLHMTNSALFKFYTYNYKSWMGDDYLSAPDEEKIGRKNEVLEELELLDSDIVCLQEVDVTFFSRIAMFMEKAGYKSYFLQKTFDTSEGLAVCVRQKKFTVTQTHFLPWSDLLKAQCMVHGVAHETVGNIDIDTVALAVELLSVETGQRLLVCDFHALFELEAPDVSVLQIALVSQKLTEISREMKHKYQLEEECPVIYLGDFNNEPSFYGYRMIEKGNLSTEEVRQLQHTVYEVKNDAFCAKVTERKNDAASLFPNSFFVPQKFYSAYKEAEGKEPSVTCVDRELMVCLDYIFYTSGLQLLSVLDLPDTAELRSSGEVSLLPSDHLPLRAKFAFRHGALVHKPRVA